MTLANPIMIAHHPIKPAHKAVLEDVYPSVFGTRHIRSFDITPKADRTSYIYRLRYRGEMGISNVTVYEKFRAADYARFRSITLTHVDAAGNISDQFHDNPAQLTTQGFFNEQTGTFVGPLIVVSLADVIWRVQTGRIPFKLRNRPRSVCTYIEILVDDLQPLALFHKEY